MLKLVRFLVSLGVFLLIISIATTKTLTVSTLIGSWMVSLGVWEFIREWEEDRKSEKQKQNEQ